MKTEEKSMFWEERGEDFEAQVLLVTNAIGTTLDNPDFIISAFDETEAALIIRVTVGHDTVPMSFDHSCELFQRFESLPAQLRFPVIKELPGPSRTFIGPQITEGFLE